MQNARIRLTGYHVQRGALASLCRTPLPQPGALCAAARRVIVLEDLVDHGNVGPFSAAPPRWARTP